MQKKGNTLCKRLRIPLVQSQPFSVVCTCLFGRLPFYCFAPQHYVLHVLFAVAHIEHKQPASFLSHLLYGLFNSGNGWVYKSAERGARHTAHTHIVGYAQPTFLYQVLGTYESGLRKSEHGVERDVAVEKVVHHLATLLGAQCRWQHKVGIEVDVKLLQSITIAALALIGITYA